MLMNLINEKNQKQNPTSGISGIPANRESLLTKNNDCNNLMLREIDLLNSRLNKLFVSNYNK